jgi:hypothetical protein
MTIEPSGVAMRLIQIEDSLSTAEGGFPNTWVKDSRNPLSESNPWATTASVTGVPCWIWRKASPRRRRRVYA